MLSLKHDGFKSSEIVVKAHSLGFQLEEVPVDYTHDEDSKAVPGGIKTIKVTIFAVLALLQLFAGNDKDGITKHNVLKAIQQDGFFSFNK